MNSPKGKVIINFRVYRRTQEHILLLFNRKNVSAEQLKSIKLQILEIGTQRDLKFKSEMDIKDSNIKDDTVMLLINHQENELDPYSKCKIRLILGDKDPITQELLVFPFSVLPNKTKDNRENYAFLFAWSEKDQAFCKLQGEYTKDGKFVLLFKQVKE